MSARDSQFAAMRPASYSQFSRVFGPAQLRKLKRTEQVAAVCYRQSKAGIQFLLVRTRSGRWTFPKGSAEPGLTHAQSAALEAFEEAGVHGRMEEFCFARYVYYKGGAMRKSGSQTLLVRAYLCEVLRLAQPEESGRNPTWFSVAKTKRRLLQDRTPSSSAEMLRIVDVAVARISE